MGSFISRLALCLCFSTATQFASAQTYAEYNRQAKLEYEKRNYDAVINAATLSLNLSLNGQAYWFRALGYYYKKNYTLSISDGTKAISYYSNDASSLAKLYYLRGDAKFESNDYDGAITDYESAINNGYSPKANIYQKLIKVLEIVEDFEYVVKYCNDYIKIETSGTILSELYYKRAIAKMNTYDYGANDILSDINMAIQKNSQNIDARYLRASYYLDEKKYALAKNDLNEVIRVWEPKFKTANDSLQISTCYFGLANIEQANKNFSEAKLNYQRTLRYDSKNGFVFWNLGRIKSDIDRNYEEASADYRKAIQLLTNKADRKNCYVDIYLHERRFLKFNKALEAINSAITIAPSDPYYYWDKAYLLQIKKENTEALANYNKALSIGIKDSVRRADLYLQRGRFKLSINDAQGALVDIQNSIAFKPGYDSYKALGDVFKIGMKQTELANGNYQKAMFFTISGSQKKDTSSDYAYAAAAMGDKITAERFIKKMIIDASAKVGALANEYHNAACIYTTLGNFFKAFEYLELSLQAGYTDFEHMLHDTDLEPLYKLPEYKTLLAKYKVPTPVY